MLFTGAALYATHARTAPSRRPKPVAETARETVPAGMQGVEIA
jgi:hypothetical protein